MLTISKGAKIQTISTYDPSSAACEKDEVDHDQNDNHSSSLSRFNTVILNGSSGGVCLCRHGRCSLSKITWHTPSTVKGLLIHQNTIVQSTMVSLKRHVVE